MIYEQDYLKELIDQKKKTYWACCWELAYAEEHDKDLLAQGAAEDSRVALAEARKNNIDPDEIAKLSEKVEDIKDCQKLVLRLRDTKEQLKAQIEYLEKLDKDWDNGVSATKAA